MPVSLVAGPVSEARPVHCIRKKELASSGLDPATLAWATANGFEGSEGEVLILPGEGGAVAGALFGLGDGMTGGYGALGFGALASRLPEGTWAFAATPGNADLACLGLLLGGYAFTRYGRKETRALTFVAPDGVDADAVSRRAAAHRLTRDLVNTPASDMGPSALEAAARDLAARHGASVAVTEGDDLLRQNFPMIHAVGRAAADAPRLIDLRWGDEAAPKVTLVGKGVCFDTGGLDIKPPSSMLNMKKDMGGAANVLGLADMLMGAGAKIRLRVLIPAVENSIAGNAFRPGDILQSRQGLTVEIGNTDAEGRLVLADALTLAGEESPDLVVDMATLTGAARVALGPDLPPFYTADEALAGALAEAAGDRADPLWRMPLWSPYDKDLSSKVADMNNVTTGGFAGSVTAALFLQRFAGGARSWVHLDVFAWNPAARPHGPVGGEAQGIRALEKVIRDRFG
ncbi:leucyl aminopeptidase [Zhengella mangrovi]|uniref:Leucyl aminopeptidase n=1 Tax=Zhengella mangrovi TaxID=1982044 RepID=A0A2G1QUA4_9HYPH|nr:leucyl aminopeptidase family protein [Zhengella mangrovi]PHP69082.1 leucyl aminopeptidase [Zhengella mangrovi]